MLAAVGTGLDWMAGVSGAQSSVGQSCCDTSDAWISLSLTPQELLEGQRHRQLEVPLPARQRRIRVFQGTVPSLFG